MNSELSWLYSTQLYGIKLGLDNVHRLLACLDHPENNLKIIHVAGTNGKGSTCAFMQAILSRAGIQVGLFTSPHLIRFNERIRDGERQISDEEIEAGLKKIRLLTSDWEVHPTFFELTLALALDWFRLRGLEWAVLETGLGGRLDATNAITPEVSVITRIGFDHMEQLGDTLTKIATEKAGIIKPGIPVVTGLQDPAALAVIRDTAKKLKSPLNLVESPIESVALGLKGPHQAWNAAVALEACREAGIMMPAMLLEEALLSVNWAGRFQSLLNNQLILDGAHNPEAAFVLTGTWQQTFPHEKADIIFAAAKDKDVEGVIQELIPIAGSWHLTAFQSSRSMPPAQIRDVIARLDAPKVPIMEHSSVSEALNAPAVRRRLVCGSLYLVGEVLAQYENRPESFQPSLQ